MAETFNRSSVKLSTTSVTDLYQAPNVANTDRSIVLSCLVANVNGTNAADVTVAITDSSNVELAKIASTISVPADASIELVANKVVLRRGEKLRITAGTSNALEATVSALEIT